MGLICMYGVVCFVHSDFLTSRDGHEIGFALASALTSNLQRDSDDASHRLSSDLAGSAKGFFSVADYHMIRARQLLFEARNSASESDRRRLLRVRFRLRCG